jgi:isopentenyl-diphosphate Delta-isomerase
MPAPAKTSLIDAVDEQDQPVGHVTRGAVLPLGANFRTVHMFVFHADRLLLQQLASSRERHPDRWGSSVAAYLHAGETYEHAARRRMWEELGLRTPMERVGKTRMRDEHSLKFIELYVVDDGPARIREREHIRDLAYWDRAELDSAIIAEPERFTPTFLHIYRCFQQRLPSQHP